MTRWQQTSFEFGVPAPDRTAVAAISRSAPSPRVARSQPMRRPARSLPVRKPARTVRVPERKLLEDPDDEAARRLERRISLHLAGGRLALAVTDNRHTMISVRREKGLFRLRLHRMFLDADGVIVRALAQYVDRNDRDASLLLGRYIDENQHRIRRTRRYEPHPVSIETKGEVHDLQALFDDLNRRYFPPGAQINARITWGQRAPKEAKRRRHNSIKMGSYSVEDKLIRIHPSLDRPFVPRHFVEWIVFHEMLHQKHAIPIVHGRRQFHTPEFLDEERSFEHYEKSRRWERENLNRLLLY